ncbi:6-phospho-3-hexuloisomerase [Agromyces sp. NPDC058126]|uniref:6-phospho-3-hexuloisomerase n=1 Tax=Agromyces sp. NPDC058126 TaxID=3346350 RepID=UPI0036DB9BF8
MHAQDTPVGDALATIRDELERVVDRLRRDEPASLSAVAAEISAAPRVFVLGAGRSGLALRMTAMRLMHLGLDVHVVGEATAPAIARNDLLLTASGSGTTAGIVHAVRTATDGGARIAAITATADSPLAAAADAVVIVPASDKLDRSGAASAQYAAGLFEQSVMLIGDAVFHALWKRSGADPEELWRRHANLE